MISLIDRNLGMTGASIWQLTLLPDGRHVVAARILGVGFRIAHADRAGGRHLVQHQAAERAVAAIAS
jgi:hypothetical protein